jgi:hypothetical protein
MIGVKVREYGLKRKLFAWASRLYCATINEFKVPNAAAATENMDARMFASPPLTLLLLRPLLIRPAIFHCGIRHKCPPANTSARKWGWSANAQMIISAHHWVSLRSSSWPFTVCIN